MEIAAGYCGGKRRTLFFRLKWKGILTMFVTPEYVFKDVTHITPEWLAAKGITALVLDIDNTLDRKSVV